MKEARIGRLHYKWRAGSKVRQRSSVKSTRSPSLRKSHQGNGIDAVLFLTFFSEIDVVPLVLQQMLRLWFGDLEDAMAAPSPAGSQPGDDMEEAFGLYRRANKMVDMGNTFLR